MSASDDIEAIKQVKARYFRLMDTKDWDGLATVFADDVHIDMTGEGGGVTESVDEYMPFIRQVIGDVITVHQGHMPEITLTSPTTATGIWALEDRLWWPEGNPDLLHARLRALSRNLRAARWGVVHQDDDTHPSAPYGHHAGLSHTGLFGPTGHLRTRGAPSPLDSAVTRDRQCRPPPGSGAPDRVRQR